MDFAVPADHKVKVNESENLENTRTLLESQWKENVNKCYVIASPLQPTESGEHSTREIDLMTGHIPILGLWDSGASFHLFV